MIDKDLARLVYPVWGPPWSVVFRVRLCSVLCTVRRDKAVSTRKATRKVPGAASTM